MQPAFSISTKVANSERRLSALIALTALLSLTSSGCGIVLYAPNRALSTIVPAPPHREPSKPAIEEPQSHSITRDIPVVAKVPLPSDEGAAPLIVKLPSPPQPIAVETGLASWYGPGFHGKLTASGDVFNQERLTAAHRTLPWGSRVKVTNLANGKSVVVEINDRGPAVKGRIIDVSRAAARALNMVESGITRVRLEWLPGTEESDELVQKK